METNANNLLQAVLAGVPILTVLVLMIFFRLSAAVAGGVGLAASVVLALTIFAPGPGAELGVGRMLGGAGAEAIFTALTILWIIFGALCLFHLQQITGALDRLRAAIGSISSDARIVAILIAWFFALFAEGAAGFGTSIALAAPFLVGFGFAPVEAVAITLIGHSVGVSFGAVGTPVVAQAQLVPFDGAELGLAAAGFHVFIGWVMLAAMLRLVVPGANDGRSAWGWAALAAVAYLAPMYLIARFVGPELPTLGGALAGALIFIGVFVLRGRSQRAGEDATNEVNDTPPAPGAVAVLRAASPYLVVIALVLVTRLLGPVKDLFGGLTWSWSLWGEFEGGFSPLFHPGTLLMAGFVIGGVLTGASKRDFRTASAEALRKLRPVTIALLAMLGLSRVMVQAGMIDTLADWTAEAAGAAWPFFSPWVGVLGTFVTGSATASNILFSEFQFATTTRLEMPPLTLLGAQTFGAAVGNIICPHNIVAGGATVGISGDEGRILVRTLPACLIYATLGGLLSLVYVYL